MIRPLSAARDEADAILNRGLVDLLASRGLAVVDAAILDAISRINLEHVVLVRRGPVSRGMWAVVDRDAYAQRDTGPEELFRGQLDDCLAFAQGPQGPKEDR